MKRLLFFVLINLPIWAIAQNISVSGLVKDDSGEPLQGVTVSSIQRPQSTVMTNVKGMYQINVNDIKSDSLSFSYVGYESQTVLINGIRTINVTMYPAAKQEELVVISALGLTRSKNSVTYSSQSVDPDRLTEARDVNIVNGLAGKVAGLQVTTTGQPGSSSRVVIRGEVSLTGNNQPLWVVDGVPVTNSTSERSNLDYGNTIADLNPDDIESMEVLKGPNAAALYGSMAANGAILVTTKKGKIGDRTLGISLNQNMMWYTITEFPAYQNVYGEGIEGRFIARPNQVIPGTNTINMGSYNGSWGGPMLGQPYNDFSGKPLPGGYSPQPDNITDFYKTSLTNVTNISLNKADANSSFRLSYTYTKGDDVVINQNKRNKHNVNFSATRKLGNKVNVEAYLLYTNDDMKNRTYRNLSNASIMSAYVYFPRSIHLSAFTPWKDANGDSYGLANYGSTENPYWMINENSNEDTRNRYIGGITATVNLTSYLKFRGKATGDLGTFKGYEYREKGSVYSRDGFYSNRMQDETNMNYEAMLMFNKKMSQDFNLTANVATNLAKTNLTTREAFLDKLLVHDMPSIANSNAVPRVGESLVRKEVASVYGNATLGYKNFLYLDVTGRNDWSSTLPKGSNSYFYPSFGSSFVFSQFIKNKSILSYGKVRASWAKVGNSAPVYYLYNTWQSGGLFLNNPTLNYSTRLNKFDLKPEQIVSKEVGLDLTLFNSRVNLSAAYYHSLSSNQIITATTPTETGYTSRVINAGEMENKGIELSAQIKAIQTKKFEWNINANWSRNKNKVLSLIEGTPTLNLASNLGATVNAVVGEPYGILLGNAPIKIGDTTLVENTGRSLVSANQRLGVYRPDWIGSLGSSFRYKGFDLSILFTVKWGGSLFSATYARANTSGNTVESLEGRDDYLFSSLVLGENDNERRGIGQTVNGVATQYDDMARPKGRRYDMAYFPLSNGQGSYVYDANGNLIPGAPSNIWLSPQIFAGDFTVKNANYVTYDASAIRLSEFILGYTLPSKLLGNGFIKGSRVALVGRNLLLLYRNTPRGIDPESANTSGNAQGIEAGGSFPYAQYGIDIKVNF